LVSIFRNVESFKDASALGSTMVLAPFLWRLPSSR
jgi:hypothetical protein